MKHLFSILLLLTGLFIHAQVPCEIAANETDSLGTYKSTKDYVVFERSFAGNTSLINFSLVNTNGVLTLDVQFLQNSADFIKANCFDTSSKIFLQLNNGKIVALLYSGKDNCGTMVKGIDTKNNRILSGSFFFVKDNYDELKKSPVTFMRIKYSTGIIDYPFKTSFVSEIDKKTYQPENYFINYLKCIE